MVTATAAEMETMRAQVQRLQLSEREAVARCERYRAEDATLREQLSSQQALVRQLDKLNNDKLVMQTSSGLERSRFDQQLTSLHEELAAKTALCSSQEATIAELKAAAATTAGALRAAEKVRMGVSSVDK